MFSVQLQQFEVSYTAYVFRHFSLYQNGVGTDSSEWFHALVTDFNYWLHALVTDSGYMHW